MADLSVRDRPVGGPFIEIRHPPTATQAAANDNAVVRIAREIRHAVNGWRHGAAVDAFAAERTHLLAAWDELRQRARDEGDAVALTPAFRETLGRHGALMKQAASFRARPQVFERLLVERAGIGEGEIEELREQHARAGSHLRSVSARAAHRARQDAPREEPGIVDTRVIRMRPCSANDWNEILLRFRRNHGL